MQFSIVLFAASALAASSVTETSTDLQTITSCGPEVTNCPANNGTISSTVSDAGAAGAHGNYYAVGAAALAAGALLM